MMDLDLNAFDLERDEVRRRFQSARMSGAPRWLWPDLSLDRWRSALRSIEGATRSVLCGNPDERALGEDADALGIACYTSGMGPILGYWVEQGLFTPVPAVAAMLATHLAHNRLRMIRMTTIAGEVVNAFEARGIEATIIKGMHTAHACFPEAGTRPLSDIDLLIGPDDEAAAGEVLRALGFEPGVVGRWPPQRNWRPGDARREPRTLRFVHADDPWSIDLQTSLSRFMAGGGRVARLDEARRAFSKDRWPCNPQASVLDQPLLLMQLSVHASAGLESLTLLRMVEIILIIKREEMAGRLSWSDFFDLGRSTGALPFAYPALQCSEKLCRGIVPEWILSECRRRAPGAVQGIVDRLEPAFAHRVERRSLGERYMWADSWVLRARQFLFDFIPIGSDSLSGIREFYSTRFWMVIRQTVQR